MRAPMIRGAKPDIERQRDGRVSRTQGGHNEAAHSPARSRHPNARAKRRNVSPYRMGIELPLLSA
jgi:hypothetical protein